MSEQTENEIPEGDPGQPLPQDESTEPETVAPDAPGAPETPQAPDKEDPEILFDGPDRLSELEEQAAELSDKLLRAVAETENVRRRSQREKEDASKYAIAGFAADMVSVADNLSRALGSVDDQVRADDQAVDALMAGVEMTLRELFGAFERTGIEPIEALDNAFDHNLHEALFELDDPEKPSGTVVQVIQQGYTIRGRLLRPAKVGVSKGGPKAPPPASDQPQAQAAKATADKAPEQTKAYQQDPQGPGANLDEEL